MPRSAHLLISQARIAVLDTLRDLVLQGADHRPGGKAGVVGCDRTDLAAQSVALVADGDPADAVRHGWGGEARDQGDAESGADESQACWPVTDGESSASTTRDDSSRNTSEPTTAAFFASSAPRAPDPGPLPVALPGGAHTLESTDHHIGVTAAHLDGH